MHTTLMACTASSITAVVSASKRRAWAFSLLQIGHRNSVSATGGSMPHLAGEADLVCVVQRLLCFLVIFGRGHALVHP